MNHELLAVIRTQIPNLPALIEWYGEQPLVVHRPFFFHRHYTYHTWSMDIVVFAILVSKQHVHHFTRLKIYQSMDYFCYDGPSQIISNQKKIHHRLLTPPIWNPWNKTICLSIYILPNWCKWPDLLRGPSGLDSQRCVYKEPFISHQPYPTNQVVERKLCLKTKLQKYHKTTTTLVG